MTFFLKTKFMLLNRADFYFYLFSASVLLLFVALVFFLSNHLNEEISQKEYVEVAELTLLSKQASDIINSGMLDGKITRYELIKISSLYKKAIDQSKKAALDKEALERKEEMSKSLTLDVIKSRSAIKDFINKA